MVDDVFPASGASAVDDRPVRPAHTLVDPEARPRRLADLRWLLPVWVLVAAFALVTAYWSHHVGVPLRDPEGKMFRGRLASSVAWFAVLAVAESAWRTRRTTGSLRSTVRTFRERWPWQRVALALSGLLAYHLVYVCYRNLKSWDAFNTPQDAHLEAFERWIFAGHSPADLLHEILGQHYAAYVLAEIYQAFTYFVPFSVVACLVFTQRIRQGFVFLTAGMWVWVLGVGSYYLIPTLGPFASAPADFAGLTHTGVTSTQAEYLTERLQLLTDRGAPDAFASISAFASLHVAFTCTIVLMLRYYGQDRLARIMTVYLAAVMVATVYFGMHFVVDDIAGVLLALAAVHLARLMIWPRGRT
ncbi:phosphatase PAP2 family protein [Nocardioides sp. KIGAM211]|uniref:Phosphatase PAP2 family protein n=1 Tax=Nocardioides luti TaxID=2761101 RepID=A0A7X0VBG6_9ACTN|nr:phosphatase PAP2 family protein [Nocardioides luti]